MSESKKTTTKSMSAAAARRAKKEAEQAEKARIAAAAIAEEAKKEVKMTETLSLHPYVLEFTNAKGESIKMFGRSPNMPALRTYVDKRSGEWVIADKNVFVDGKRTDEVAISKKVQTLWADKDGAIYVISFDQTLRTNEKEGTTYSYLARDIGRLLRQADLWLPEEAIYEDGVQVDSQRPSLKTEKGWKAGLALLKSRPDIYYNWEKAPYMDGFTYTPCAPAPVERELPSDEGAI